MKNFIALNFKLLLNYCLVVFLVIMIPLSDFIIMYNSGIKGSLINPWTQSIWQYMFIIAPAFIIGGKIGKIVLLLEITILIFFSLFSGGAMILFKQPLDGGLFHVIAASSSEECQEFLMEFCSVSILILLLSVFILLLGIYIWIWRIKFSGRITFFIGLLLLLPFSINAFRYWNDGKAAKIRTRSNLGEFLLSYYSFLR